MKKLVLVSLIVINLNALPLEELLRLDKEQLIENLNKASKKCLGGNVEQCDDFLEYLGVLKGGGAFL